MSAAKFLYAQQRIIFCRTLPSFVKGGGQQRAPRGIFSFEIHNNDNKNQSRSRLWFPFFHPLFALIPVPNIPLLVFLLLSPLSSLSWQDGTFFRSINYGSFPLHFSNFEYFLYWAARAERTVLGFERILAALSFVMLIPLQMLLFLISCIPFFFSDHGVMGSHLIL